MRPTNKTGPRVPRAPIEGHERPWGGSRRFSRETWSGHAGHIAKKRKEEEDGCWEVRGQTHHDTVPHAKMNYFWNLANSNRRMSPHSDVFVATKLSHGATVHLRSGLAWPRPRAVSCRLPDFGQVHYLPWVSAPPL